MSIETYILIGIAVTLVVGGIAEYKNWKKRKQNNSAAR